ncbi:hypothetical protein GM60_11725 [Listeria monocytogenes]|uniref:Uncharacterized protein n=1 Tax=Listeria monocytogenes TaxID=1639 RepID=A0AAN2W9A5_LISMN|nr:hypothetical protein B0X25_12120 [Listeria monocytogenes]EAC2786155.1 hypothetical protein [Listeria monocytogenes]EAC6413309.1 hypothetical protein [Listeria monocytogenes]EAC7071744.1 hypothetical protein [Listeria monocytogenes]EAC7079398.1 hypothetical protein [Listeria monocytogenes]
MYFKWGFISFLMGLCSFFIFFIVNIFRQIMVATASGVDGYSTYVSNFDVMLPALIFPVILTFFIPLVIYFTYLFKKK